jgi:hypothetical protein
MRARLPSWIYVLTHYYVPCDDLTRRDGRSHESGSARRAHANAFDGS